MKITTWNKLWSYKEGEQTKRLASCVSIHPSGQRTRAHTEKNRLRKAQKR